MDAGQRCGRAVVPVGIVLGVGGVSSPVGGGECDGGR